MICKILGHNYKLAVRSFTVLSGFKDVKTKSVTIIHVCSRCGQKISHDQIVTSNS